MSVFQRLAWLAAHRRRRGSWLAIAVAVVASLVVSRAALAHEIDLSRGDYRPSDQGAEAWIEMSRGDLVRLLPNLDADGDGALSDSEITPSDATSKRLLGLVTATRGDVPCAGSVIQVAPSDAKGGLFGIRFGPCEGESPSIRIAVGSLFTATSFTHRQTGFVHVPGEEKPRDMILHGQDASVEVPVGGAAAPPPPPARGAWDVAKECFTLGVEHIWFGIDHVVFLVGLVLLGGRLRDLAATITAFTVSHSITLAATVLGIVAPSPSLIEPLIALSVAYVGVENFIVKDIAKRWRIAGIFGFIHGFGFAGAVGDKLPTERLPVALATFNLGVEAGQLVLLFAIVPVLTLLRKRDWFERRGVQVLSGAVVVAGLFWFIERVFVA
ncbi:MAG: HupE/UreJ family protein [Polyangiaceae bacterium]|nr:HupE/UreJ family protein [Polyangiaceae bacterium]